MFINFAHQRPRKLKYSFESGREQAEFETSPCAEGCRELNRKRIWAKQIWTWWSDSYWRPGMRTWDNKNENQPWVDWLWLYLFAFNFLRTCVYVYTSGEVTVSGRIFLPPSVCTWSFPVPDSFREDSLRFVWPKVAPRDTAWYPGCSPVLSCTLC